MWHGLEPRSTAPAAGAGWWRWENSRIAGAIALRLCCPATVGDNQKPIAPTRHRGSQSGSTRPVRFKYRRKVLRWLVSGFWERSMTGVWAGPAGVTASIADRPIRLRFRNSFWNGCAGACRWPSGARRWRRPTPARHPAAATIETCSGNQSAGIASGTDFTARRSPPQCQ